MFVSLLSHSRLVLKKTIEKVRTGQQVRFLAQEKLMNLLQRLRRFSQV